MSHSKKTGSTKRLRGATQEHDAMFGLGSRSLGLGMVLAVSFSCAAAHAQVTTGSSSGAVTGDVRTDPNRLIPSSDHATQRTEAPIGASGATAPLGSVIPNEAVSAVPASDPYADVQWKGLVYNLPPPAITIDGDYGARRKLAEDYGIGYGAFSVNLFYDNVLRHDHSGPQLYIGQKPTGESLNTAYVVIDLSRYGIPDGQIVVDGTYQSVSWNAAGPTTLNLGNLTYYQTLFNKHVEVKAGLLGSTGDFYGSYTGGNLGGGLFGPAGSEFIEGGGAAAGEPTYGVVLTGHPTDHIYDKLGIVRSGNPSGVVLEHNWNPTSTRFSTPNTGVFVLNELGYKAAPTPSGGSTWVRFGTGYSSARHVEQDHPQDRSPRNYLLYLNADQQLLHISQNPRQSYRGLYAGFSVAYVPPNLNLFSQYYEARVYGVGLLPHRPFDQVSLVATEQVFSSVAYSQARTAHRLAHSDSKSITLSYSYSVRQGLLLDAAVAYANNPTALFYTHSTGSSLNLITGLALFF